LRNPAGRPTIPAATPEGRAMSDQSPVVPQRVTLTDIDIPFWRIVAIILKWSIASIPAIIIYFIILAAFSAVFGGIFMAIFGHMGGTRI
jgi:hypothetical protein